MKKLLKIQRILNRELVGVLLKLDPVKLDLNQAPRMEQEKYN